ncbi:N-acetylmuramoyl-L-alanine amidase [Enterococcus canis]|uniref:N-acetylmuramoyl-L-alanine amidase n=2 Tax=Enterococcus canis TaxID=214095 RepID=A0A1L8RJE0_9ENTE|nr:N-acetylmuramoyl-L-alanine amidase [Enterococcus canis]
MLLVSTLLVGLAFIASIFILANAAAPKEEAQTNEEVTKEEFIERIAPHARELQEAYGVLPSIIIGQAILESNWGQSQLASKYNNLFGIKAYGDVKKISLKTQEFVNEEWITTDGDFRVYDSWEESMDDHTNLFLNGTSWNPQLYQGVIAADNYRAAAQALQDAGYATDPGYAQKVIEVIETYQLNKYD